VSPKSHLDSLREEAEALAVAAAEGWERPVPACPGWRVDDVVGHIGKTHQWVMMIVASGQRIRYRDLPPPPEGPEARLAWYREGFAELVTTLEKAPPDQEVWTFSVAGDERVSWWRRRMAIETAVHRWDVQATVGTPDPVDADLARDGVDEYLWEFLPAKLSVGAIEGVSGTLHLHATDHSGEWWLDLDAPGLAGRREHAKADTAVRGPVEGMLLWLWNRQSAPDAGLEVLGRADLVDAWKGIHV
jgi:uncharacterized protein (TIGR03083 family)